MIKTVLVFKVEIMKLLLDLNHYVVMVMLIHLILHVLIYLLIKFQNLQLK